MHRTVFQIAEVFNRLLLFQWQSAVVRYKEPSHRTAGTSYAETAEQWDFFMISKFNSNLYSMR
ncbi:MAG: hypothetical protein ACI4KB_07910 [Oscillospiraceae bacterium]|nr:hypothetical protein [Oscillospiraceae bacterium]